MKTLEKCSTLCFLENKMKKIAILFIGLALILLVGVLYLNTENLTIKDIFGVKQLGVVSASGENWWNNSFSNRIQITFNNTNATENLMKFAVPVFLNSTRINYSLTQDLGQDIRFVDSDNTTVLPYEIEIWNESNYSYVWVQVPQIDSGSTSDYIWMYYGNSTTGDLQNSTGVWDANFTAVYHLGNGSTLKANDSTSNFRNGTIVSVVVANNGSIDGSAFYPTDTALRNINLSVAILSTTNATAPYTARFWLNTSGITGAMGAQATPGNPNRTTLAFSNLGRPSLLKGGSSIITSNTSVNDSIWHQVTFTKNTTGQLRIYVDGILTTGFANDNLPSSDVPTVLGLIPANSNLIGYLDEVAFSDINRSTSWIYAEYISQKDIMNAYGSSETSSDTTPPQWFNNYTNSTTAGSTINHSVNWTDNVNLSSYIFSFDNGNGTFLNDSFVNFTGTANQSNITKVVNSTVGSTIQWKVYANDSSNNLNVTSTFQYTTTAAADTTAPQWSNNQTNSTTNGTTINHSVYWTDETQLSGYIFSWANGNQTLANDSWVAMIGTTNWSNITKNVNTTVGSVINWSVYANDSSNNWNVTNTFSYTTTAAAVAGAASPHTSIKGTNNHMTLKGVLSKFTVKS